MFTAVRFINISYHLEVMPKLKDFRAKELSDKVVIATTTFYKPDLESDIFRAESAKGMIRSATDLGYRVVVVDGGSSDELLKEFEVYGANVYVSLGSGMGISRRHAIQLACNVGREIIAWTEPEKGGYIKELVKTVEPILSFSTDIIIPRRKSLSSYPTIQRHTEIAGNLFWAKLTGYGLDMWFGPRTFKREVSGYFLGYNGEYGDKWDSIFIPVMDIILDGKNVEGVTVNYAHPKKQTEIEEHDLGFCKKRFEQLTSLTNALDSHWKKRVSH